MNSESSRLEHAAQLSTRPDTLLWDMLRKTQSAVSNGFIHRWAARQIPSDAVVLDAACGDGRLARVRKEGAYIGFDFVERLAARAKRFTGGAPIGVADILAMPIRSSTINVVTCFEVLEHLDDPAAAIAEFARVLRPDGRLFLSVPNDRGLKHRLKHDPHPLHHGEMDVERIRDVVETHLRIDTLIFRGIWLFTPGPVSVQIGLPADPRIATNILLTATKV